LRIGHDVAVFFVGRCHASKCGKRGPHRPASRCRFDTAGQITKHAQASGQGNAAIFDFKEQTILAQRAAEDVFELLAAEKTKSADLLQANKELENIGQLLMEFDMSSDKKVGLREELTEAHRDLEVTDENGQLWQMVPEKRLNEHSPEELAETKAHALDELRKQLEQARQELR